MKLDLKHVELHSPLFLAETNFGKVLYAGNKGNKGNKWLDLWYDTDLRHTFVVCNGEVGIIESTASKTLNNPEQVGLAAVPSRQLPTQVTYPQMAGVAAKAQVGGPNEVKFSAQVSTPHDKVQGKPGRKAKYQGEETQGE